MPEERRRLRAWLVDAETDAQALVEGGAPEPGGLVGRRVGVYSRQRIDRPEHWRYESEKWLNGYEDAELVVVGVVRHVWIDSDGDVMALIEEENGNGRLLEYALTGSTGFSDAEREVWLLAGTIPQVARPSRKRRRSRGAEADQPFKTDRLAG